MTANTALTCPLFLGMRNIGFFDPVANHRIAELLFKRFNQIKSDQLAYDDYISDLMLDWGFLFQFVSPEQRKNPGIVLAAVKRYGEALEYASPELKANKEVVLAAVKSRSRALKYAAPGLKANKEVVLAAVKSGGGALEYVAPGLEADKEVVLAAVKSNGVALKYAASDLKADKEMVLAAIESYGEALEYASPELKADKEVVLAAVKSYGGALAYAAPGLEADKEVVLAAVKSGGGALEYAAPELKADKEVVLASVKRDRKAIKYAAPEFLVDDKMMLAALKINRYILYSAGFSRWFDIKYQAACLLSENRFQLTLIKKIALLKWGGRWHRVQEAFKAVVTEACTMALTDEDPQVFADFLKYQCILPAHYYSEALTQPVREHWKGEHACLITAIELNRINHLKTIIKFIDEESEGVCDIESDDPLVCALWETMQTLDMNNEELLIYDQLVEWLANICGVTCWAKSLVPVVKRLDKKCEELLCLTDKNIPKPVIEKLEECLGFVGFFNSHMVLLRKEKEFVGIEKRLWFYKPLLESLNLLNKKADEFQQLYATTKKGVSRNTDQADFEVMLTRLSEIMEDLKGKDGCIEHQVCLIARPQGSTQVCLITRPQGSTEVGEKRPRELGIFAEETAGSNKQPRL